MKSSLVSATSLIALLVFDSRVAEAATMTIASNPLTIYDLVGVDGNGATAFTDIATVTTGDKTTLTFGTITGSGFTGGGQTTGKIGTNAATSLTGTYSYTATDTTSTSTATITVRDVGDGGVTQTLTLSGTGVAPVAGLTGNNAGYTLVGSSNNATATITNTGNGNKSGLGTISNLRGTIGSSSSGLFTGTGAAISVGDTSSATVTYLFTPTQTGAATATVVGAFLNGLNVTNAATSITSTITGTGVAPVAAASGTDAGYVLVGSSANATVTITNSGNGNLSGLGTISNARGSAGTAGSSAFVGTGATISLADASSQAFTYAFTPTGRGATTTTVVTALVNATGAGGANQAGSLTTTLGGTGVAPILGLTSTASAGYVLVTQSANTTVTVTNSGDGNKSGLGTISNLRGTLGTGSGGGFSGTGTALSLTDTSSSAYSYVFTPTTRGTASTTVASTFANGNATNGANTATTTLIGTGVAAVNSVTSSSPNYVRVGTTGTVTVSISNIGDGNLSGAGTISNLRGNISTAVGTAFTANGGNPASASLADAASTTLGFTYTPVSRGSATATTTISFLDGSTAGNNAAQTITATVSAQGVAPTYKSSLNAVTNTATAVAGGATGAATSTIAFGSLSANVSQTIYLALQNTTTDPGAAALTNLTLENFSIWGGNASNFSVSLANGTIISAGGQILVPITVTTGSTKGLLGTNLTFFTDEFSALGGLGNTFTYSLTALNIPEPASLALLGAGLAGLAAVRRRRKILPS